MLQEAAGGGPRIDPKAALARALAKPRWKPKTTGFGPSLTSALKQTAGALISPVATVADVVAAPIEKVTGKTLFRPEDIGSFNLLQSGGRATEHVAGDVKELGRSVITGQDTLSQSPSARAYQRAGGGFAGTMAAVSPYLELAGYAAPIAGSAGRNLGLLAPRPTTFAPVTSASLDEARAVFGAPRNVTPTPRNRLARQLAEVAVPRPSVSATNVAPRLQVPTMAPTVPEIPAGFPLPEVPSNLTLLEFQRMPEFRTYAEAGRTINPQQMAGFALDPETAYLVHSGRGRLVGGQLDPTRTLSGLNQTHISGVTAAHNNAMRAADSLQDALDTFIATGAWNGDELAQRMPPGYRSQSTVPLSGVIRASDMTQTELQSFVDSIQTQINIHRDYVSSVEPYLSLAEQEPFLSYYPASVGAKEGYMRWHSGPEGGGMYLAGVPAERATTLFGPGVYEKQLGVPEWQAFGAQTPIASITEFPSQWGGGDYETALYNVSRAFAVQKTIEDRARRGLYQIP